MLRLTILAVGKCRGTAYEALVADYTRRFTFPVAVHEIDERKPMTAAQLRHRETTLLIEKIPSGAYTVALDPRGKTFSSEDIANFLRQRQEDGTRDVAFLIGGADGLTDEALTVARLRLSFGSMIWPHLLARVMLVEQLYRAQQILIGHPYHRG
ncbi:MAG: 23S rRNA (pseudouridine(1915)-N(3))-methyltransferase RlmH [Alphaproteobacteria bacterium]